jgi:hypothetical protein
MEEEMMKKIILMVVILLTAGMLKYAFADVPVTFTPGKSSIAKVGGADKETKTKTEEVYGKLPLSFIQNNGQTDKKVKFYEKGAGHATFFTEEGVYLQLVRSQKKEDGQTKDKRQKTDKFTADKKIVKSNVVKIIPLNANPNPQIIAEATQGGKVNYFIGNDPEKWKTNIPTYGAVVYKDLYKGIDLKFYGNNRQMEYDIIVKPGGDPSQVHLAYEGIDGISVAANGDLEITLHSPSPLAGEGRGEGDKLIQKRPKIYQEINGKKVALDGRFKLSDADSGPGNMNLKPKTENQKLSYTFEIASYNKDYPLIIDPVLVYSTYLGGSGGDIGYGIAVDSLGNAYITGDTGSADFPTQNPIQGANGGFGDVFVTKINSAGNALVYSTYLGGSDADYGCGIAVDGAGNANVTGWTISTDFPTQNPIQGTHGGGGYDAFITKINSAGDALVYSTYLGGSGGDYGFGIAVDSSDNAYVTGRTTSTEFPTQNLIQGTFGGYEDAFVTKINSAGNALVYSTYLGGWGGDDGRAIAVDGAGNAYVTGMTDFGFPTHNPIQGTFGGKKDAFVTKINSAGNALVYSTYLGGSGYDMGYSIAVDGLGNAYVTGETGSTNFPILNPIQGTFEGYEDAFVTKINSAGNALVYSTYLGGSGSYDIGYGIAVDGAGNAYVTGWTDSTDFPTQNPIQVAIGGTFDAFVTKINSAGNALVYSTYLGGYSWDGGFGIAVDGPRNVYVTGDTNSTNFPILNPIQVRNVDSTYVFVTKIGEPVTPTEPSSLTAKATSSTSIVLAWKDNSDNETGFKIERKDGDCASDNPWAQIARKVVNAITHTNTELTPNTTYSYRVRAYNAAGNSSYSGCVSATTGLAETPKTPTDLKATSISTRKITLVWKDNSLDETSFKIYRKLNSGTFSLLQTTAENTISYSDTTATGSNSTNRYSYYISACNAAGCSPVTNTAAVPLKPTGLTTSAVSSTQINLSWTDNSSNETGFQVYRKAGACSSTNTWTLINTTEADATSFNNTGLTTGQTYSYKVRSFTKSTAAPYANGFSVYTGCSSKTTP